MSIQDIINSTAYQQRIGYTYHKLRTGRIVFSANMTGKNVVAIAKTYNPEINLQSIPDKYLKAALHWIQYRYYAMNNNPLHQHHYELYKQEMSKVRHNRIGSPVMCIGDDI